MNNRSKEKEFAREIALLHEEKEYFKKKLDDEALLNSILLEALIEISEVGDDVSKRIADETLEGAAVWQK